MTDLIQRIEEALEQNWAVEAEDIRALLEAYKKQRSTLDAVVHSIQNCKTISGAVILGDKLESRIFNATIKDND